MISEEKTIFKEFPVGVIYHHITLTGNTYYSWEKVTPRIDSILEEFLIKVNLGKGLYHNTMIRSLTNQTHLIFTFLTSAELIKKREFLEATVARPLNPDWPEEVGLIDITDYLKENNPL
ncbi:hypothetical protein Molly5_56 [Maribacter phage Molly_5]|uniref:Uncharacterized protein n=1 Tax=Maribacter phage Molly_1 TaxID=2745685 RepID=A0A8E4UYH8_9CAUD|nr:hypothetical protein M1M29_gp056 [Maribacter phage Molly_1]QQO97740.1 hypothetical protein Molly2_56 [Maribacter phage Molly_2]QQO97940.1 hypothetical protein Molly3_56 [Maribacter phage Molly_3]QQO98140.1 hypothetical protein Molly4_56 [Maribacter phage Molly_4]QQO98340.1 hypothetical protein Molly5_56 [Maribacter phage Molly_5]QQO97540.1 hypothetical protein Molly1_56 [Maribacter phage Molly_1]